MIMKLCIQRFTLLLSVLFAWNEAAEIIPEQFHLALAGANAMSVSWFTYNSTLKSLCHFGTHEDQLSSIAFGSQRSYHHAYGSHHVVELKDLQASTKYFYSCGDGTTMSSTFSFTSSPSAEKSSKPLSIAIFGDMVS